MEVTVNGCCVMTVPLPALRGPELKPLTEEFVWEMGMQGVPKSDWMAEWSPRVKLKITRSPAAAMMSSGWKTLVAFAVVLWPTLTT